MRTVIASAASFACVALAGCATSSSTAAVAPTSPASSGHVLSGTVSVPGFDPAGLGTGLYSGSAGVICIASAGYEDLEAGGGVTVKDGTGAIIGTAKLEQAPVRSADAHGQGRCAFPFSVTVPDVAFYQVSAGNRNALSYSRSELVGRGWNLALNVG